MYALWFALGILAGVCGCVAYGLLDDYLEKASLERNKTENTLFTLDHQVGQMYEKFNILQDSMFKDMKSLEGILSEKIKTSNEEVGRLMRGNADIYQRELKALDVRLRAEFEGELQKIRKSKGTTPMLDGLVVTTHDTKTKKGTDIL